MSGTEGTFRKLWPYVRPYRLRFVRATGMMICYALLDALLLYLLKPVVDQVFRQARVEWLPWLGVAILGIALLKGVCNFVESYDMQAIGHRLVRDIRNAIFSHLMVLPLNFYRRPGVQVGGLLSRLTSDAEILQSSVTFGPRSILRDGVEVVFLLGVLFALQPKWALIALAACPVIGLAMRIFARRMHRLARRTQQRISELHAYLSERIHGILLIKAHTTEPQEIDRMRQHNQRVTDVLLAAERAKALQRPIVEFATTVALVGVVLLGGWQVLLGRETPGTFAAFVAVLLRIYQPARSFADASGMIQRARAASERIFSLLEEGEAVAAVEPPTAEEMPPFRREIRMDGVWFAYGNGSVEAAPFALRDIRLAISRGERVAIVGPSGSGKTTLACLLLRFYEPASGRILIDEADIRRFRIKSLRNQIGVVPQEVILFHDTVAANIAYGRPSASETEIRRAARAARAEEFIERLPQGYQTVLGERGVTLSGGQKQRIAIARAILRDPAILILDEAMSELDAESEDQIRQALENLYEGRTVLVIAHRFATVRRCDRIVVMDSGRIADTGTHDELMARCLLYRRLYETQLSALS